MMVRPKPNALHQHASSLLLAGLSLELRQRPICTDALSCASGLPCSFTHGSTCEVMT